MAHANNGIDSLKAWWRGQSQRNKLFIGGGAGLLLLLVIIAIANSGSPGYGPYGPGYPGQGDQGPGYATGYPGEPGTAYSPDGSGPAAGDDPTGYWDRQRSQEQRARGFSDYIRDNDTVRDNTTGEVYTDVPNTAADAAVQSGDYSQVPTAELPTSTPAPAPAEAAAPAE